MISRFRFWLLNIFWAVIVIGVALNWPEQIYLASQALLPIGWGASAENSAQKRASNANIRGNLSKMSVPEEFLAPIASLHMGEPQKGTDGKVHNIDSITGITDVDGAQIYDLVRKVKPTRTLEIGFAYGVSTLYFLAAIRANGMGSHTAIDPYETKDWNGIGLMKVKEVKMEDSFRFMPERSHPAMGRLADNNERFEIIFIDGAHLFDIAFADFVLADALCPEGGYILLHDTWMDSIRRIESFIMKNRKDYARQLSTAHNIAIYKKIAEDRRDWRHYVSF